MKIYNRNRKSYVYSRYGNYKAISRDKMLYRIKSLSDNSYCLILKQDTLQNRPFKVLSYSLSTNMTILLRQEIITNNKCRPIARKKICLSMEYLIHDINSKNINCSKLDIQMLYRVMNHFVRKNKINSI